MNPVEAMELLTSRMGRTKDQRRVPDVDEPRVIFLARRASGFDFLPRLRVGLISLLARRANQQ